MHWFLNNVELRLTRIMPMHAHTLSTFLILVEVCACVLF